MQPTRAGAGGIDGGPDPVEHRQIQIRQRRSSWAILGDFATSLAVGLKSDKRLELFVVGGNNAVWEITEVFGSASWNYNWVELGAFAQSLSVGNNADGTLELFAVGNDNGLNTMVAY